MCSPEVLFKCAFQLFDVKGLGLVTFGKFYEIKFKILGNFFKNYYFFYIDNFKEIINHTLVNQTIPFDFECEFINSHFGKDKQRQINYQEFTQIIHVKKMIQIKKNCL